MKYIKSYEVFESSGMSKAYLVDKIKYLSNWLHTYMKDTNTHTTNNLNFRFSYDTVLDIIDIFTTTEKLHHNSPDGFITTISNEFVTWSRHLTKDNSRYDEVISSGNLHKLLPDPLFLSEYDSYTSSYKSENNHTLYSQQLRHKLYVYVGERIKQMISGTKWDIPLKKKFTNEDKDFVIDCLVSEYDDVDIDKLSVSFNPYKNTIVLKIPNIGAALDYDSSLIARLQSYFGGALISTMHVWNTNYFDNKVILPFFVG